VPALDALRGIAIMLVLGVHSDLVPGGWLGVDLFFVLSGFLITSLVISEYASGGVSFRGFYRRRVLRLGPALVVMLAAYALVGGDLAAVAYGFTYVTNLVLGIGAYVPIELQHLWSLAAEEQFYLVWPPLLVLALRGRVRPRALCAVLGILALTVATYRFALMEAGADHQRLVAPDAHADPLLIGCLAGVAFSYGLVRRIPLAAIALAPVVYLAITLGAVDRTLNGLGITIFSTAAAVILLELVLQPRWWFSRVIDRAPVRYMGRISYGLYLWHWPIIVLVGWEVGVPIAIAVAALSYRYVETPFLRKKRRRTTSASPAGPAPLEAAA
jgi:peptidoglycan/LPS O-acetylase OafA/YrhL